MAHAPYRKADWKLIAQAPAASRLIERGIAGPGLLAHVLVAQHADHLPLYLQSVIYGHEGVELSTAFRPTRSVPPACCCVLPTLASMPSRKPAAWSKQCAARTPGANLMI